MICDICLATIKDEGGRLESYAHEENLTLCLNCYKDIEKEKENPRVCDWREQSEKEDTI